MFQVFAETKDEIAVVLFGTDGTDNALAARDQYENITVQRHLMLPDFQLLEEIQEVIQPGAQQADCILPSYIPHTLWGRSDIPPPPNPWASVGYFPPLPPGVLSAIPPPPLGSWRI